MQENNDFRSGLWKKTSQAGNSYYSCKMPIDGKEYWVNLFKNNNKKTDQHPDLNIIIKPVENHDPQNPKD